jgi:hypothetical protein
MSAFEYRVKWQREEISQTTRIYQTEAAAMRKADGIVALDAVKVGSRFADMPDLIGPVVIERRAVEAWEPFGTWDEPSDEACARMEEWATPGSQSGVATGGDW